MHLKHSVMNAPERSEYARALTSLMPVLEGLPPSVVAIDGAPGVGKTTLGRFLAWRFNISLIETDLFLLEGTGHYRYRDNELHAVLNSRLRRNRPAIFDGVVALRLLRSFDIDPQFHIHVTCEDVEFPNSEDWRTYVREFNPVVRANLLLSLPAIV